MFIGSRLPAPPAAVLKSESTVFVATPHSEDTSGASAGAAVGGAGEPRQFTDMVLLGEEDHRRRCT